MSGDHHDAQAFALLTKALQDLTSGDEARCLAAYDSIAAALRDTAAHERERCARISEERRDSNAERQKTAAEMGDTKNAEWFRARACIAGSIAEEIREFREPFGGREALAMKSGMVEAARLCARRADYWRGQRAAGDREAETRVFEAENCASEIAARVGETPATIREAA